MCCGAHTVPLYLIAQNFDDGLYHDSITTIDVDKEGTKLYHIVYEDGDEENIHYRKCRFAHNLHIKLENQDKKWDKKWESGDK